MVVAESQTRWETAARRVLDSLELWQQRLDGHHTQKRTSQRTPFRSRITVAFDQRQPTLGRAQQTSIEAWSRNISPSGICFVHHQPITVDEVVIHIPKDSDTPLAFRCEIVRRRQIHEGFWEIGAKFLERVHSDGTATAAPDESVV